MDCPYLETILIRTMPSDFTPIYCCIEVSMIFHKTLDADRARRESELYAEGKGYRTEPFWVLYIVTIKRVEHVDFMMMFIDKLEGAASRHPR